MEPAASAPGRRRRFILAAFVVACAAASVLLALRVRELWRQRTLVEETETPGEIVWEQDRQYAVSPVLGWFPRANFSIEATMFSIDGRESARFARRTNNLGFVDADDLDADPGKPTVLLVGDSHLMGVVSNGENASKLLERDLRADARFPAAAVVNASAGYYSLYQLVLRARTLAGRLRPAVVVLVSFAGNDLLELEDVGRPHLDDALAEHGGTERPSAATSYARLEKLRLPSRFRSLVDQGMNQASYVVENPDREAVLLAKAARCIELFRDLAREHGFKPVVAILPSYDMVFPEPLLELGGDVRRVIERAPNAALARKLGERLDAAGIARLGLLPEFQRDRSPLLFAGDFHIWREGHRRLEKALLPRVEELLR